MNKYKPESIRTNLNMNQEDFCKAIGVSISAYHRKLNKKSRWYVNELLAMKKIGKLESIEQIDWN